MQVKHFTPVCVHRDQWNEMMFIHSTFISTSQMVHIYTHTKLGRRFFLYQKTGHLPSWQDGRNSAVLYASVRLCSVKRLSCVFQCYMHDKRSLTSGKVNVPWTLTKTPEWHMMKLPHVSGRKRVIWAQEKTTTREVFEFLSFSWCKRLLQSKCPILLLLLPCTFPKICCSNK